MSHSLNNLNSHVFDAKPEMASMRRGFGESLVEAGESDKNVVVLCADLAESTQVELFKQRFPERFVEMGVAEQNLAAVASGMAAMGKIPFMASYAVFSPGRNWEQIRTTIAYNNVPVKIIGSHAGLNVGPDGGSHQMLEDIALMRTLPRMVVISPCDAIEARKAAVAVAKTKHPTYIRLAREKSRVITIEDTPFEIGKATILFDSRTGSHVAGSLSKTTGGANLDIGIIATGSLVYEALKAAKLLEKAGKSAVVLNISTIKPLDEEAVIKLAHESRTIVTVEEHQIACGLGGAVSECLAQHFPVPIEFIGVNDKFGQSGTAEELIDLYGLSAPHIFTASQKAILRKCA